LQKIAQESECGDQDYYKNGKNRRGKVYGIHHKEGQPGKLEGKKKKRKVSSRTSDSSLRAQRTRPRELKITRPHQEKREVQNM